MLLEQSVKLTPGISDRTAHALNAKFRIRMMLFHIRLRQNHRIYIIHLAPAIYQSIRLILFLDIYGQTSIFRSHSLPVKRESLKTATYISRFK